MCVGSAIEAVRDGSDDWGGFQVSQGWGLSVCGVYLSL